MTYLEKARKIYNFNEWLFPVPLTFSGLTERPDLAWQFKEKFPEIYFNKFVVVDGSILIQDCTPALKPEEATRIKNQINELLNNEESRVTFQLVDGLEATKALLRLLPKKDWSNTLIVFPGNGAQSVRRYLDSLGSELTKGVFIPTKRTMTKKGQFEISVKLPDNLPRGFSEILVIDDVIASGQTAKTVACALARKFGILPPINFACWIMLENQETPYPAGLPYFDSVFASLVAKPNIVRRPPINSLSCFLDKSERYDSIKDNYARRYLPNGKETLNQLEKIISKGD